MEFKPKTANEIAESKLLPKGVYYFEVLDAHEKISQSGGNPMIELLLRITDNKLISRLVSDYLMPQKAEKLRQAAVACDLLPQYDSGSLADADFKAKRGKVKIGIEKGKNGFPDKNVVLDYLRPGRVA